MSIPHGLLAWTGGTMTAGSMITTPKPSFVFSKCKVCRRLHAIIDGKNYNYLDGCFHSSHTHVQHYKLEGNPKTFKIDL